MCPSPAVPGAFLGFKRRAITPPATTNNQCLPRHPSPNGGTANETPPFPAASRGCFAHLPPLEPPPVSLEGCRCSARPGLGLAGASGAGLPGLSFCPPQALGHLTSPQPSLSPRRLGVGQVGTGAGAGIGWLGGFGREAPPSWGPAESRPPGGARAAFARLPLPTHTQVVFTEDPLTNECFTK